ncbi:hypothetical protein LK994_04720 [Ferruginibacter lapsinanis]|uniref:hypothetical protein n=1 Tax=Ferruginibacter lapsinanis TaxID=563172 RepID=UPI001E28BAFB|nr:hypothetical protein [Ferruginibacter lapsinanis]UEG50776.1 hypothetical protein LK994_04720 [Ferruginibacter lapsinanis]
MKRILLIISFFLIVNSLFAQKNTDSLLNTLNSKIDAVQSEIKTHKLELVLQDQDKQDKRKPWIEKNGPWLIALVVGLLTILANVIINRKQQIAQLRVTLKSKNRQEWINELRNCITEFTTQCKMINIEFQDKQSVEGKKKPMHEKITFNRTKLVLLLNPNKNEHKPLLIAIGELLKILDAHLLNSKQKIDNFDNLDFMERTNKVIELGTELSYYEWQRMQKLEK